MPGALAEVVLWLARTGGHTDATSSTVQAALVNSTSVIREHTAVVIFSGVDSTFPQALRSRGARVVEVDIAVGDRFHAFVDKSAKKNPKAARNRLLHSGSQE